VIIIHVNVSTNQQNKEKLKGTAQLTQYDFSTDLGKIVLHVLHCENKYDDFTIIILP